MADEMRDLYFKKSNEYLDNIFNDAVYEYMIGKAARRGIMSIIIDEIKCFWKYGKTVKALMDESDLHGEAHWNGSLWYVIKADNNVGDIRLNKYAAIGSSLYEALDNYFEEQFSKLRISTVSQNTDDGIVWEDRVMIVCDKCMNKRCPHATDESFACTNSNDPGQAGSIYTEKGIQT